MDRFEHPLKCAGRRILEEWGMMLVDDLPVTPELFDPSFPTYLSWIDLRGVVHGSLSIVAQEPFMRALAANLLGDLDPNSHNEADCQDAFREMANVLAGNFLTEAYGVDTVFDLIHPHVRTLLPLDVGAFTEQKIVFGFLADDLPIAMSFRIDGAA